MNSKKLLIIVSVLLCFSASTIVLAQNNAAAPKTTPKTAPNASATAIKNFCAKLDTGNASVINKITNTEGKLQKTFNNRETRQQKIGELEQKVDAKRVEWDTARQAFYAKLLEKAGDDTKKQAVEAYKQAVETAIVARRTAIDEAVEKFRKAAEDAVSANQSSLQNLANTYKSSVQTLLDKAKTECQAGPTSIALRTTLMDGLKAAKDKFATEKKSLEKARETIKDIKSTLEQEKKKAVDDFKTAMEKAETALKAAFDQAKQTPSPSNED